MRGGGEWTFYEFFAGGGMARAGLGEAWRCVFANDIDPKKAAAYKENWTADHLTIADVSALSASDLPGRAHLAWASFPCQDLSLAGAGAGLHGERSGTFWPFWRLMQQLVAARQAPRLIVLENVCGALTSHSGSDFAAIGTALTRAGYSFGGLVIDAVHFVPQSRPRLFIVAADSEVAVPQHLAGRSSTRWHTPALLEAHRKLTPAAAKKWVWWTLPALAPRTQVFADLIEEYPEGVQWHTPAETRRLLSLMSDVNRRKVREMKRAGRRMVGGLYKRTRVDEHKQKVQRAEVRFDEVAGCLRTPVGGSSRQTLVIVDGTQVRSRLLSPREAARLMGLPDSYKLPTRYNDAYHLAGDGVVVPVVRYLAENLLEPLIETTRTKTKAA